MNIIWNQDELKKIKKIILQNANLEFDNEKLILSKKTSPFSSLTTIFDKFSEELEELFFTQDRDEIKKILLQASQVKSDINNPLHLGLVISLSKTDINDHTQIFEIFKQLISQYERVINNVLKKSLGEKTTLEILKAKMNEIKNGIEIPEEKQVKEIMNEIFLDTNGIEKSNLFNTIVNNYNNILIKDSIYRALSLNYNRIVKENGKLIKDSINEQKRINKDKRAKRETRTRGIRFRYK